jgi:hypothetical protein
VVSLWRSVPARDLFILLLALPAVVSGQAAPLEGWIWSASVGPDGRDGHDLVVTVRGGENLRVAPNGDVIARVRTGMRTGAPVLDLLEITRPDDAPRR